MCKSAIAGLRDNCMFSFNKKPQNCIPDWHYHFTVVCKCMQLEKAHAQQQRPCAAYIYIYIIEQTVIGIKLRGSFALFGKSKK